ncbi:MAG: hypothetical protein KBD78_14430 [Oligoflexales bacterium]|nr:hypothetical protein [Oligoflexales bacterium]
MPDSNFLKTFQSILKKFEDAKIDYMIVGSIASMTYGEPRLTHDMDLVIEVSSAQFQKLVAMFQGEDYYVPPVEILVQEALNQRSFNVLHIPSGLKVNCMIRRSNKHSVEEFQRRRQVELIPGVNAYMAAPEDVIIKKLQYFIEGASLKHINDVRGILAHTKLD